MANTAGHRHRTFNGDFWAAHQSDSGGGVCRGVLVNAFGLLAAAFAVAAGGVFVIQVGGAGLWRFCGFCRAGAASLHYGVGGLALALAFSVFKCVDGLFDRLVLGLSA